MKWHIVLLATTLVGCTQTTVVDRDMSADAGTDASPALFCLDLDECRGCGTVAAPTCASCVGSWQCGDCFELPCHPSTVPPATPHDAGPDGGDAGTDAGDAGATCTVEGQLICDPVGGAGMECYAGHWERFVDGVCGPTFNAGA